MVDKTPEEIALNEAMTSNAEKSAIGTELEEFGKRLRSVASARASAISGAVKSGIKKQIDNIKDIPKNFGKAILGSLPPAAQALVSGVGAIGSDIASVFRRGGDSPQGARTTPPDPINLTETNSTETHSNIEKIATTSEKHHEEFEWLSVIAENTEETNLNVKRILEFLRGNRLEDYEQEREQALRDERMLDALSGLESNVSEAEDSSGKGFLAAFKRLPLLALGKAGAIVLGATLAGTGIAKILFGDDAPENPAEFIRIFLTEGILGFFNKQQEKSIAELEESVTPEQQAKFDEFREKQREIFEFIPRLILSPRASLIERMQSEAEEQESYIDYLIRTREEIKTNLNKSLEKRSTLDPSDPNYPSDLKVESLEYQLEDITRTIVSERLKKKEQRLDQMLEERDRLSPEDPNYPSDYEFNKLWFKSLELKNILYDDIRNVEPQEMSSVSNLITPFRASTSGLIAETSSALNLMDQQVMTQMRPQSSNIAQQVNVNNNSSSNVIMPKASPNGRVETAQDIYGPMTA